MLNELYGLSHTLGGMRIEAEEWHREYKPLPKVSKDAPCLRIWLSGDGTVSNIEALDSELVQTLRKFGNNQGTIPAFNIAPLYRLTDEQQIKELDRILSGKSQVDCERIRSWCVGNNWNSKLVRKLNNCLCSTSRRMLELMKEHATQEHAAFMELLRLADGLSHDIERGLRLSLEECVYEKLRKGEDIKTALAMLFYKGKAKAKDPLEDCGTLSVILDLADWREYGAPTANDETTRSTNAILIQAYYAEGEQSAATGELDAFGTPFDNINEPMPNVRLMGLGDVTLRAMFNGQPCQYRYKRIDDASYPITKENRSFAKQSLEWMSAPDRKGLTWQKVDKNEVIFVYPSRLPPIDIKFAALCGTDEPAGEEAAQLFEEIAKDIVDTLRGISPKERPEHIQIFSLRKMDKARSKVVFSRNCTVNRLIDAAREWELGCGNTPRVAYLKGETPFPLQVAQVVNNIWKQSGELANQGETKVKQMDYYQGMELLLDFGQQSEIRYILSILLSHASGLIKFLGNWMNGYRQESDKARDMGLGRCKREAASVISVLGLLLYKSGQTKEAYMENAAYLVGQILKVSDELHAHYCMVVRDGSIPPQLAGNSMFVTATETPVQALAQLGTRMMPYVAWAKQYQTKGVQEKGKESWLAGWYLSMYRDITDKLHSALSNTARFDDFGKAQVFIGYLASFPKREKLAEGDTDDSESTNEVEGE